LARSLAALADRIGRALVAPRAAFEDADRGIGGASDALLLLLLKFVVTELRAIVAAVWTGVVVGPSTGFPALLSRLSAAIGIDLVLILASGVVITIGAGRRRSPSRDFELASVAWMPVLVVTTVASLIQLAAGLRFSSVVSQAIAGAAIAWMAVWVVLAIRSARRRPLPDRADRSAA
jgi:hypothetical protein